MRSHLDLHLKRLGDIIVSYFEAINMANRFILEGQICDIYGKVIYGPI